jgi:26S proteasome regulatory subunit N8
VPFEEDEKDPSIWFLDHSYLETMFRMFRKVNGARIENQFCLEGFFTSASPRRASLSASARWHLTATLRRLNDTPPTHHPPAARECVVGWYHTGPRLREADLDVAALVARQTEGGAPVLVVCDVEAAARGRPAAAYVAREEVREDGTAVPRRAFANLPTEVAASEAEEIGVEHLLRDVRDATATTLAGEVSAMVAGLRGLVTRLREVRAYLAAVADGALPPNHEVLANLQDMLSLLPNLGAPELARAFAVESNDMLMAVYLASLVRAVVALHGLVANKEARAAEERARGAAELARAADGAAKKKAAAAATGEKEKEKENAAEEKGM